jgi:hypothetical protein
MANGVRLIKMDYISSMILYGEKNMEAMVVNSYGMSIHMARDAYQDPIHFITPPQPSH